MAKPRAEVGQYKLGIGIPAYTLRSCRKTDGRSYEIRRNESDRGSIRRSRAGGARLWQDLGRMVPRGHVGQRERTGAEGPAVQRHGSASAHGRAGSLADHPAQCAFQASKRRAEKLQFNALRRSFLHPPQTSISATPHDRQSSKSIRTVSSCVPKSRTARAFPALLGNYCRSRGSSSGSKGAMPAYHRTRIP